MRARWLGIVLAAAMAVGCYSGTEVDREDGGAADRDSGTDGSAGQPGGGGNAGITGGTGGGSGEQDGGSGGTGIAGKGGTAGGAGGESGTSGKDAGTIDCSIVGCAAPPLCSTGCTEPCGCCPCVEGDTMGAYVCKGGCWAESGSEATFTGRPCLTAAECGPGFDCFTQAPGGYCLPGAPGGPTACREPEAPCPPGTACSPLPLHQISGVCLLACETSEQCRQGYVCGYVELFPGDPATPRSTARVCWTVCQPGADQTCNDNPIFSSLHGVCQADGTCKCNEGVAMNPDTGRCL